MSDFSSSLPIRTEANGDAAIKIVDGTVVSQTLTVNADGSVNITDNGASLTVDANNLDIRDLVFATDKVDVTGSEVSLDAATLAALESITVQNPGGAGAVNIQDGGNSITVDAVDLDIRDLTHVSDSVKIGDGTDFLAVNSDGSINVIVSQNNPGTEINDYNTATVASSVTSNHDYTTLGTVLLTQVEASASGKMKIEVQVETGVATNVFNTRFVQFNSTATPNMHLELTQPISVATGVRIRVIRTNLDNQSQDLYSTICVVQS